MEVKYIKRWTGEYDVVVAGVTIGRVVKSYNGSAVYWWARRSDGTWLNTADTRSEAAGLLAPALAS